jgi:hypothetical protein
MTGTTQDLQETSARQARRLSMTEMMIGFTLLAVGLLWLLDAAGVWTASWYVVLSAVLTMIGVALIAGSPTGEHGGLIAIGIILTVLLTGATWADLRFDGGLGDRTFTPASTTELEPVYRVTAGTLTLDLRQIELPPGDTRVEARVGAGDIEVIVPADMAVEVDWRVAAGEVTVFTRQQSGTFLNDSETTAGFADAEQRLILDVIVTAGTIEVRR